MMKRIREWIKSLFSSRKIKIKSKRADTPEIRFLEITGRRFNIIDRDKIRNKDLEMKDIFASLVPTERDMIVYRQKYEVEIGCST